MANDLDCLELDIPSTRHLGMLTAYVRSPYMDRWQGVQGMKLYGPTGRPWEREFFKLAGYMLQCKLRACNQHPERIGVLMGELDYGAEMGRVLKASAPRSPLSI